MFLVRKFIIDIDNEHVFVYALGKRNGVTKVKVERQVMPQAKALMWEDGYLVVEAEPRAGLTLFLSQLGSEMAAAAKGTIVYINATHSEGSMFAELGRKLGQEWEEVTPRSFLAALTEHSPLVVLLDGLECLAPREREVMSGLLKAFSSERMFCPSLMRVYLVVGVTGKWEGAKLTLGYFTRDEVARLLERSSDDPVALALYAWTGGAPELTRELARGLLCCEQGPQAVYMAVQESAKHGRLSRVACARPTLTDLRRQGLARERPVPAVSLALKLAESGQQKLVVNRGTMEVRFGGRLLPLFPQEMRILCLLVANPGRVYNAAQIYASLTGGQELYLGERSIKAQVSRLRSKLPHGQTWIITRRGIGYAFNPQAPVVLQ